MRQHSQHSGYQWTRQHRHLPRVPRNLHRVLAVAAVWLMVAPVVTYLVSGSASIVDSMATPSATSAPSPVPRTATNPQVGGTIGSPSAPSGTAAISAQPADTIGTMSSYASAPVAQSANGALTNAQSSGSAPVSPQTQMATLVAGAPPGAIAGGAAYYQGLFSVDTNGDGATDAVNFVLVDTNGDGQIDTAELSSDDGTFGEGTLDDSMVGDDDDESFVDGVVGATFGATLTLGTYQFGVVVVKAPTGPGAQASISAQTWSTGAFSVDIDARGSVFPPQTDGGAEGDQLGFSVASAGDVNGDGVPDFIVGAPSADPGGRAYAGSVYVHSGVNGFLLYQKDGEAAWDNFGWSVAGAGDVNGDGRADFIVGALNADPGGRSGGGSVYVYSGASGALLYQKDGGAADDWFGQSVAGAGDVNGDGRADFIVGAPGADPGGVSGAGSAYVYSGADGSLLHRKDGTAWGDAAGYSVAGVGDVNGDGRADFIMGALQADPGGRADAGSAYVYSGADGSLLYQRDGAAQNDAFSWSVAGVGDINGDGRSDFMVGAPFADPGGRANAGSTYVYSGANGSLLYQKDGEAAGDDFGWSVAGAGDVNGDGKADFIVGAPSASPGDSSGAGSAYVYSGANGSLLYQKDGSAVDDNFGYSVSGIGDVNGDGRADFIVGAAYADPAGRGDAGSAYAYSGADGSVGLPVLFVLSDTDSDGRYDTIDLSTDDATFGEGNLGQPLRQTGANDDERLTIGSDGGNGGGTADVRLGAYYLFTVAFDNNPAGDADDARITAMTRHDGFFVFDADVDGSLAGGDTEKLSFVLEDMDSDGLFETMDLSLGLASWGNGNLSDKAVLSNTIGGAENNERLTRSMNGAQRTVKVGLTYNLQVAWDPNPALDAVDASVSLVSDGTSPVAYVALGTANAGWLIDADGDGAADDRVSFVLTDTDSDGLVDKIDVSIGDTVFGEGNLADGEVDFSANDNGNDERVAFAQLPLPMEVRLGAHRFLVEASSNPHGSITARWYQGSFFAEVNGNPQILSFVQVSPNSDGLYTVIELDDNHNGSYQPNEVHLVAPAIFSIAGSSFTLNYANNPTIVNSVALVGGGETPAHVALPNANNAALAVEAASQLLAKEAEAAKKEADAQDAPEVKQLIPARAAEPPPARMARDINNQPLARDEVVVRLSPNLPDAEKRIRQIAFATGATIIGAVEATRTYQLQYEVGSLSALDSVLERLQGYTGVASASHHYLLDELAVNPNDSQYPGWDDSVADGWDMRIIRLPEAWETTTGTSSVRVAVLDADFDRSHEDLRDNIASVSAPKPTKAGGHGTHVSGTICARGDNGVGVAGVAWDCSLSLYDFGGSSPVKAQEAMIAAIQAGARVINMSLQWVDNNQCGTPGTSATAKKVAEVNNILVGALDYAKMARKDVLWVFAAGNECRDTKYASPASLVKQYPDNVIVVGSVGPEGNLSSFSNYGDLVTVVAPGEDILSTLPNNSYGVLSGTSMAAPHVSGLAALIMSRNPSLSAARVKQCIISTGWQPSPSTQYKLIDAAEAMSCN